MDQFEQALAQVERCDQEALELLLNGVARELVEQTGQVFTHLRVSGEQTKVFIQAAGLGVVVSRADVAVVLELALFLTDNKCQLAVGLEPNQAIHNVNASFFKLARPADVGLLVKACLDLNQGKNLLACFCSIDEGLNNGTVTTGAVQSLLDGQHVGVRSSLFKE